MKSFLLRLCLPVETLNAQIGALHFLQYLTQILVECIGHLGVDSRISNDTTTYYVTNVTVLKGDRGLKEVTLYDIQEAYPGYHC